MLYYYIMTIVHYHKNMTAVSNLYVYVYSVHPFYNSKTNLPAADLSFMFGVFLFENPYDNSRV